MVKKYLIITPDEESIFELLGLPYKTPDEREIFSA